MTYELTNEEKIAIVEQHIKNLEYSKYNLQAALIAEQALTTPDSGVIMSHEAKIAEIDTKRAALLIEISNLTVAGE